MTYIIAEAGVNHNGSLEMAKQLAYVAKEAGADAVKFQTFKSENMVTKTAAQATYQVNNLGKSTSQFEMLKKLELSFDAFTQLKQYCESIHIEFLSTPFDPDSVDFLLHELQMKTVKISSGELTNYPFIYNVALHRKPIILSTGMATMEEIDESLAYIAYGLAGENNMAYLEVKQYYATSQAKELLEQYVTILHCTTEYPASYETINLKAMEQLKREFKVRVGLSDHSQGIAVPIAAVALGAEVIEKHFTLDKFMEGPDHLASLDRDELKVMVQQIRQIERALGDGVKQPSSTEMVNRIAARKSIVAKRNIRIGERFTEENLTIKRPGNGLSPSLYWKIIGNVSVNYYNEDELIDEPMD